MVVVVGGREITIDSRERCAKPMKLSVGLVSFGLGTFGPFSVFWRYSPKIGKVIVIVASNKTHTLFLYFLLPYFLYFFTNTFHLFTNLMSFFKISYLFKSLTLFEYP